MPISDLKVKFSEKNLKRKYHEMMSHYRKKYYPSGGGPQDDLFYGFLCLIYDGTNNINLIKRKFRNLFISTMRQLIVEDKNIDEFLKIGLQKDLILIDDLGSITLTQEGRDFVENNYLSINYTSQMYRIVFSVKTVMLITSIILSLLSLLKIIIGIQVSSQGMISEGLENLTDLIKVAIIFLGIRFNKDRLASIIIVLLMLLTGINIIWSGITALINPTLISPTSQAFIVIVVSIIMNLGLMFYKGMVGRATGNLSLLTDSKDSELNVIISAGVFIGLIFAIFKLYLIDALVGIIIAILVIKEGIEFLRELLVKEKDFDITRIKVKADLIFNNKLTGYLLASIKREKITYSELINNFEEGLQLGRQYYETFADYSYDKLNSQIFEKHLNTFIEEKYIELIENNLNLTQKGIKLFKKSRWGTKYTHKKYHTRKRPLKKIYGILGGVLSIIMLVLLIFFVPFIIELINSWIQYVQSIL